MKNIRTTIPGIGMAAGGIVTLASMLLSGTMPTAEQWAMFGSAIVTGFGLIAAADARNLPPPPPPSVPSV